MARAREQAAADPGEDTREKRAGGGAPDMADLEYVKGLIEAVDSSGIDSLEITRAGTRLKISKTPPSGAGATYYATPPAFQAATSPYPNAGPQTVPAADTTPSSGGSPPAGVSDAAGAATEEAKASGLVDVRSPMVGTFYEAPAPEAPPYVEVGTRVTKGQTLCILEAMKLMNELESEVEGVVRQVLVDNAEPVEYGQVLFRIDPNG